MSNANNIDAAKASVLAMVCLARALADAQTQKPGPAPESVSA